MTLIKGFAGTGDSRNEEPDIVTGEKSVLVSTASKLHATVCPG